MEIEEHSPGQGKPAMLPVTLLCTSRSQSYVSHRRDSHPMNPIRILGLLRIHSPNPSALKDSDSPILESKGFMRIHGIHDERWVVMLNAC